MGFFNEWDESLTYRQRRSFYRQSLINCLPVLNKTGIKINRFSEYELVSAIIIAESGIGDRSRNGGIIELWSETIPDHLRHQFNKSGNRMNMHINEHRFMKTAQSQDATILLDNLRIGINLIAVYKKTAPTVDSILFFSRCVESGSTLKLFEQFYADWS